MQEIYTMIQNTGVTLVIVVIFLWQYISDIKDRNEAKKKNTELLEEIRDTLKDLIEYFKK